jgi:NADPH2:quinone reductase
MKAIRVHQYGGAEALQYEDVPKPTPAAGDVLLAVKVAGVNFLDVYQRKGVYKGIALPFTAGSEAAGVVESVGEGVTEFKAGDRVAYASQLGSYAEYAVVPAAKLVPVPNAISHNAAAAAMLQGMTAHYLAKSTYPIQKGDTVLVHAGAGGVGLLLTQIAKRLGATVITTVSTAEKAKLSHDAGADHVILYTEQNFETEVKKITNGKGVAAVYDSVGKTTFDGSLNSLRPRGMMVLYGAASGPVPPFELQTLNVKGSIFITRPSLVHYIATRDELLMRSADVLGWIADGTLKLRIEHIYSLKDAPQAHRDLEDRKTTGKLLIIP